MISFRDAIAGVLIGAVEHDAWPLVFVSCVIWAILCWLFVSTVVKKAEYKSAPRLSFVSPSEPYYCVVDDRLCCFSAICQRHCFDSWSNVKSLFALGDVFGLWKITDSDPTSPQPGWG